MNCRLGHELYVVHDGLFLPAVDRLKSEMKRKRLLLLILIPLLIIGVLTFFGEKGILQHLHLQKELVRIKEKNAKLEVENQKLKEEVKRLQTDKRYIEEIARRELGMVKQGEIVYQFEIPGKEKENSK